MQHKMFGSVLIVEDNQINRTIASKLIESFGLAVTTAETGAKAVELFTSSTPNTYTAILMDIQMPIMDGYEATTKIRSLKRPDATSIPIIAMTAETEVENKEKCLAAGMNYHLSKPLEPQELYEVLSSSIEKSN